MNCLPVQAIPLHDEADNGVFQHFVQGDLTLEPNFRSRHGHLTDWMGGVEIGLGNEKDMQLALGCRIGPEAATTFRWDRDGLGPSS